MAGLILGCLHAAVQVVFGQTHTARFLHAPGLVVNMQVSQDSSTWIKASSTLTKISHQ